MPRNRGESNTSALGKFDQHQAKLHELAMTTAVELHAEEWSQRQAENRRSQNKAKEFVQAHEDREAATNVRAEIEQIPETDVPAPEKLRPKYREESVEREGRQYRVRYVGKEKLGPAWGLAVGKDIAFVREDLPPRVKGFVREHELYHLRDPHTWGGVLGREVRANVVPALKDPIGAAVSLVYNLNPERLLFYWHRLRRGY